jgi:DNA repair protein RadC
MDIDDAEPDAPRATPGQSGLGDVAGHRARLRERFRRGDGAALGDQDLLEALLFVIPRRDVRPIARALVARFGSFAGAISAPRAALRGIPGLGETAIDALKLAREAALRLAREEVMDRPVLSSWDKVLAYARAELAQGAARSTTRRSTRARSCAARWSSAPARSSCCTTIPRATRRRRARTST